LTAFNNPSENCKIHAQGANSWSVERIGALLKIGKQSGNYLPFFRQNADFAVTVLYLLMCEIQKGRQLLERNR